MTLLRISMTLLLIFSVCSESFAGDWPAFRGPQGNGISTDKGFPTTWSSRENVKWRITLPGPGNGSPIVIGNKVILLCAEDQGRQRSTICFDRSTGDELWKQTVEFSEVEETHKTNPYCPSTPASDGTYVYVWHRSAGMYCYDLSGKEIWSRDLGTFEHIWGGGPSPVLYQDLVIQLCGPGERTFLTAFDKATGETRWETEVEPGGSASDKGRYVGTWATPVLVNIEGKGQLLCPYHRRVVSYDPATGKELAWCTGLEREKSDLCYTSPMVGEGVAVIMGGFQGPAFGWKLGGSGDTTESHRLWRSKENGNPQRIGSGIVIGKYLYMANADGPGSIECSNIETGEQQWEMRRTPDGPHWASIVLADGKLYATGQKGITTVFLPTPDQYTEISVNKLDETTNATPAFADGEIFIRTWDALYCIQE